MSDNPIAYGHTRRSR